MQKTIASLLVAPVLIGLILASVLCGQDRLAFRDVSHFYTPLYDYVAHRGAEQWIPLWNPLDVTGMPLLGETTTAFFYPVRYLLFSLPLSTETALGWYVAVHLLLASWFAFYAARVAGAGRFASIFASIAYPLSGSILFLYCNPPFLVAAAWLPLALAELTSSHHKTIRRIVLTSIAICMMILAGDPQAGLHVVIVASLIWLVRSIRSSHRIPTSSNVGSRFSPSLRPSQPAWRLPNWPRRWTGVDRVIGLFRNHETTGTTRQRWEANASKRISFPSPPGTPPAS